MMHSVGFYHEQSRSDRDEFIKVQYQNIRSGEILQATSPTPFNTPNAPAALLGYADQFEKLRSYQEDQLGEGYDYLSIMHYDRQSFTKSARLSTIVPLKEDVKIGQRQGFSSVDLFKINKLYRCPDSYNDKIKALVQAAQARKDGKETVDDDIDDDDEEITTAETTTTAKPKTELPEITTEVDTTTISTPTTTTEAARTTKRCTNNYSDSYCNRRRNRGCRRSRRTRSRCQKTCGLC